MTKCLLCEKEGLPTSGLTITEYVCKKHYEILKELEDKNKKHHERAIRKIRRAEISNKRS